MGNRGIGHPEWNAVVAGLIAVAGGVVFWLGVQDETGRIAGLGGLGLLAAIVGIFFLCNFLWAVRIVRAMRSGRTAMARWTLSPEQFGRFREIDGRFAARGDRNDYRPPRHIPARGVDVIFSEDSVLIGNRYFGLATSGLNRITSVRQIASDPPMIEFATATTAASNMSRLRIFTVSGTLRVPVASEAATQGEKVALRYRDVVNRRTIVKPHFWTRRIRGGLIVAAVSAILGLSALALAWVGHEFAASPVVAVLAVGGVISAIGGLIVAFGAWLQRRGQYQG